MTRGLANLLARILLACILPACILLAACEAQPPMPPPNAALAERVATIPMRDGSGQVRNLTARICRPSGPGPFPVTVINHGGSPNPRFDPLMMPAPCDAPGPRWFLARGYLVVASLRRGFGASEGPIAEASGPCEAPDYEHAGRESARDVAATVAFAQALPEARADGTVVIGLSTGGWATIAYADAPASGVVALISMAGGRGGRASGRADTYCAPERLIAAAGAFGARAKLPMLWVSARNDTYFSPAIETAMAGAFNRAGGRAELVVTPDFEPDGHAMFTSEGGELVWGPIVERYLAGRSRSAASAPSMISTSLARSTAGNAVRETTPAASRRAAS